MHLNDQYNVHDYQDAYGVLFWGKTGDGKSTTINAFFNIVKGIKLEDNYRFILIKWNFQICFFKCNRS